MRRAQTRYSVEIAAELTVDGVKHEDTITNLSLGGCHVAVKVPLSLGTRLEISFQIPTQAEPVRVGGQVRWCDESGAGIQFDGLRAKEVWSLNKYFGTLSEV